MVSFNPSSLLFFVACWTIVLAVIDGDDYKSDLENAKRLDGRIKAIVGSSWWPAAKYREYAAAKDPKRTIFFEGLFNANDRKTKSKVSSPSGRVSIVPKDATATTAGEDGKHETTTAGGRPAFGGEAECVSANKGRPCACYTTDFLDSVGSLLDGIVAQEDVSAAVVGLACRSYRVVPSEFVVSSSSSATTTAAAETTTRRFSENAGGINENITDADDGAVPARREVDFNYVVNYQLEKSNDGEFYTTVRSLTIFTSKLQFSLIHPRFLSINKQCD